MPLAQQVIIGLLNFFMSLILVAIVCRGMFLEPGIAPESYSPLVLTSIITASRD